MSSSGHFTQFLDRIYTSPDQLPGDCWSQTWFVLTAFGLLPVKGDPDNGYRLAILFQTICTRMRMADCYVCRMHKGFRSGNDWVYIVIRDFAPVTGFEGEHPFTSLV